MKEERNKQGRDRAALTFAGVIPDGDYNREVQAVATGEGIEIDNYVVIPWEWIFAARARLEKNSLTRSEDSAPIPYSIAEREP